MENTQENITISVKILNYLQNICCCCFKIDKHHSITEMLDEAFDDV